MLNKISAALTVIGYAIFFFTDGISFPLLLIAAGFIVAIVDLVVLYTQEKLMIDDYIKEAFRTNWGSAVSIVAGIGFLGLCLF